MEKIWSLRRWSGTIILVIVVYGFVSLTFYAVGKNKVQAREIGYQSGLGHPMKYKDLPPGQYKVVAVVNQYSQTAVVQKQSLADGLIREDAKEYFLVTDMMPQQMTVGYLWGEIQ